MIKTTIAIYQRWLFFADDYILWLYFTNRSFLYYTEKIFRFFSILPYILGSEKESEIFMRYIGNIYRPPSEAYSLIVQMTVGCSHNRCAFCNMYRDKHFFVRAVEDVLEDFAWCRERYTHIKRIFLADGDALMASTADLMRILKYIQTEIPECERVTCYASPKSVRLKSDEELAMLRSANLQMVYMGLESGDDDLLRKMRKGCSAAQIVEAAHRVRAAGIALSVTAISGLGGKEHWQSHAQATGAALSAMKADYVALLTLLIEPGTEAADWVTDGSLTLLNPQEILEETYELLSHTDSEGSVFRMNHASNYLSLRGTLNRDKEAMLKKLHDGMEGHLMLKHEGFRAL